MPDIRDVVYAVQAVLEGSRGEIDAIIKGAGAPQGLKAVLPYYSNNVDIGMYNCLMIDQSNESARWLAMPAVDEETFHLTLWGLVHHDNPLVRSEAAGRFAGAVKNVLNRRHLPILLPDGNTELYFNNIMPVSSIAYGVAAMETAIVGAFQATFSSNISVVQRDPTTFPDTTTHYFSHGYPEIGVAIPVG